MAERKRFGGLARRSGGPKAPSINKGGGIEQLFAGIMARDQLQRQTEERRPELQGKEKAVSEAVSSIGSLKKLLPVLDEFELEFGRIFPEAEKNIGFPGKLEAAKAVIKAKMDTDPDFAAALDQLTGKRSQIAKGLGEVGNLAEQEQKIAMQNVPELSFQGPFELFLPEAPATGSSKLRKFRDFVHKQIIQNLDVIDSGGDVSVLLPKGIRGASPIPGSPGYQASGDQFDPQSKIDLIKQRFKQRNP